LALSLNSELDGFEHCPACALRKLARLDSESKPFTETSMRPGRPVILERLGAASSDLELHAADSYIPNDVRQVFNQHIANC